MLMMYVITDLNIRVLPGINMQFAFDVLIPTFYGWCIYTCIYIYIYIYIILACTGVYIYNMLAVNPLRLINTLPMTWAIHLRYIPAKPIEK